MKPFGGCEAKGNTEAATTAAIKGRFFFNMENNYVKQLEDALINAAVNKQLELERMGCASEWGYILALENLLINYKREYWIKRGIELFKDNIFNPF